MEKINYEFIKDIIELEKCSDHNESPKFIETKDGFRIIACCDDFTTRMIEKSTILITEQSLKSVLSIIKKYLNK